MEKADTPVVLYGAAYSVYVRIVRAVLHEKQVAYEHVPVDVFAAEGLPADYYEKHPFGRIPAFEHGSFRIFETTAIARYVDEAFPGPVLQPAGLESRTRMNQIIALLDSYAYRAMVWDVYVQRVQRAGEGGTIDEGRIAAGLRTAGTVLAALTDLAGENRWLAGAGLTLADLHAAPIVGYFVEAPEGAALLKRHVALADWWKRISARPSIVAAFV